MTFLRMCLLVLVLFAIIFPFRIQLLTDLASFLVTFPSGTTKGL